MCANPFVLFGLWLWPPQLTYLFIIISTHWMAEILCAMSNCCVHPHASSSHFSLSHISARKRGEDHVSQMESIPRKCWRDYISHLVWERHTVPQEEKEDVAERKYAWNHDPDKQHKLDRQFSFFEHFGLLFTVEDSFVYDWKCIFLIWSHTGYIWASIDGENRAFLQSASTKINSVWIICDTAVCCSRSTKCFPYTALLFLCIMLDT